MALTGPPAELWVTPLPAPPPGALRAAWRTIAQSVADLWRALGLLLLFAPSALTAYPALQYGIGRSAWMLLFRCGGWSLISSGVYQSLYCNTPRRWYAASMPLQEFDRLARAADRMSELRLLL